MSVGSGRVLLALEAGLASRMIHGGDLCFLRSPDQCTDDEPIAGCPPAFRAQVQRNISPISTVDREPMDSKLSTSHADAVCRPASRNRQSRLHSG